MYEILNNADILVASFEDERDCDRYMDAVALLSDRYSKRKRSNGNISSDDAISAFVDKHDQLKDYAHINLILYSLNAAITGKEEFSLTERVIPFVRFFFASVITPPEKSIFEIIALFSRKDITAIINYIRTIHSNNVKSGAKPFAVCKAHNIEQALLVFYTAAQMSDLGQFLNSHNDLDDVFFMSEGHEFDTQRALFEAICACTQGFTLTSELVSLAAKICTWLNRNVHASVTLDVDTMSALSKRATFRVLNLGCKLCETSRNFEYRTYDLETFNGIESLKIRYTSNRILLNLYLSERLTVSKLSDAGLSMRYGEGILEKTETLDRLGRYIKEDSISQKVMDDLDLRFKVLECVYTQILAHNLMCVINVLAKSGDAAQKLSQRANLSYVTAIELCYVEASKVYKLSSEEIFELYIQTQASGKTLFEYQWPLLQEFIRSKPELSGRLIVENFKVSNFIDFIERNLNTYGRLFAYGTIEDFENCGLLTIMIKSEVQKALEKVGSRSRSDEFEALSISFHEYLTELDVDPSFYELNRIQSLAVLNNLTIDVLSTHEAFLESSDLMKSMSIYNEDRSVSIHILPKHHPLNLFVGSDKVSNCCMYPQSAGYSCCVSAYMSHGIDVGTDDDSHIIVGYDHINKSFIGSNWTYRIGSIKYRSPSDMDTVESSDLQNHPEVFQLDQFELSVAYTNTKDETKVDTIKEYVKLTVESISNFCSTGIVLINAGGYSEDLVSEFIADTYQSATTFFKESLVCFGFTDSNVYSDAEPSEDTSDSGMANFGIYIRNEENSKSVLNQLADILRHPPCDYYCNECDTHVSDCGPLLRGSLCESCLPFCPNCDNKVDMDMYIEYGVVECKYCRTCDECGRYVESESRYAYSVSSLCSECGYVCDECGDLVPESRISIVGHEREAICEDCVVECESCGKKSKSDDLNEYGLCEMCQDDEDEDDEDEDEDA